MKIKSLFFGAAALGLLAGVAAFNSGCGKPTPPSTPPPKAGAAPVSAVRTSFAETTAQLDPGGNFYAYLGTAQWLEHLGTKVESWRKNVTALPDLSADNLANINKGFDLVNHLILDSGIQDATGVGASSIEIEPGLFRNKAILHHYAGTGNGFLWKLGGVQPHALAGLDLLPANTALAGFADLDLPLLWKVTQDEVAKSGFPQAQAFLKQLPDQFEQRTQLKWDDLLKSFGGEYGFVLTLNESNNIPIPLPTGAITIPEPGLMLVVKINNDLIFDRIDEQLKANQSVIAVDDDALHMRTLPVPLPFIGTLRPTTASSGGYLFIATSDALVNDALAVKSGKTPGLKSTAEFKRLSQNIPTQGNSFSYLSESAGRLMFQIQQQVMNAQIAKGGSTPAQTQWLQAFYRSRPAFGFTVGLNTSEGAMTVANTSMSYANIAILPAAIVPAMLAGVALPNFVKARGTAQQNACINNLRQLDAAENQWALEKGKKTGDACTADDLKPYIKLVNGQLPKCPAGGHYTIGPVGEAPKCSLPGHELP